MKGNDAMKLDPNCVRDILLLLESVPNYATNSEGEVENDGIWFAQICNQLPQYTKEDIYYTLSKLEDGGYINMTSQWAGDSLYMCCVNYITFQGHEFLDAIRPDTVWEKTTATAGKIGNFGLKMLEKIAEGVATAYFKEIILGD